MATLQREAFFLDAPGGGRFCLLTRPRGKPLGGLLFVPPFAEELNKSRRMVALGARAFAERGWLVLQLDCYGCGDSAGDFGDATWQGWVDDVALGCFWLRSHCNAPLALWTLRAGSLLASQWFEQSGENVPVLMWQPVTNGRQHLTQFLRLKAVNEMLGDSEAKTTMARVRQELQSGIAVEVAGYPLSPALAGGLEVAVLRVPPNHRAAMLLLEVCSAEIVVPSPAVTMLATRLEEAGVSVMLEAVPGPAFWQTQEIETAPALVERSAAMLENLIR